MGSYTFYKTMKTIRYANRIRKTFADPGMVSLRQVHHYRFGAQQQEVGMRLSIRPQFLQLPARQQIEHRLAFEVVNAGVVAMAFLARKIVDTQNQVGGSLSLLPIPAYRSVPLPPEPL